MPWFNIDSDVEDIEQTIYRLIALGTTTKNEEGSGLITSLLKKIQACENIFVLPTLSPKDPNYKEWSESEEGKRILAHFQEKEITAMGTEEKKFYPIVLNENIVNLIYKRCLPKEDTPLDDIVEHCIFLKKNGFSEDGKPFYFRKSELEKNYKNIAYMLGQLYDVHVTKDGFLYLKNFSKNYKGDLWIESSEIEKAREAIFNLIALGSTVQDERGIGLMGAILYDFQACTNIDVYPTLSPKDPAFDEWSKSEDGKRILARFQK